MIVQSEVGVVTVLATTVALELGIAGPAGVRPSTRRLGSLQRPVCEHSVVFKHDLRMAS